MEEIEPLYKFKSKNQVILRQHICCSILSLNSKEKLKFGSVDIFYLTVYK